MTKTVLVICFFIGVSGLAVFSWKLLASDTSSQAVLSEQTAVSRGFGQLMHPTIPISTQSPADTGYDRKRRIAELLSNLEKSGENSISDWENNQNKNLIPVPTLIEGVNELVTTPKPSLAPVLAAILEQESLENLNSTIDKSPELPSEISTNLDSNQFMDQTINNIGNLNINPIKTTIVMAVLGDSMVETLGPALEDLRNSLNLTFPTISIALLNYGQGATDMEHGLYRLTHTTKYLGKIYPPLLSFKPDILIVESFAYNPWSANQYDLDRQWLTIAKIIDTVKANSPATKIILAATISPNPLTFGDGVLNWGADMKWEKAQTIKSYLSNLVNFASSQGLPLADAYHPSLSAQGIGDSRFINSSDHLHPSKEGAKLFSEKIVDAIKNNNLLQ